MCKFGLEKNFNHVYKKMLLKRLEERSFSNRNVLLRYSFSNRLLLRSFSNRNVIKSCGPFYPYFISRSTSSFSPNNQIHMQANLRLCDWWLMWFFTSFFYVISYCVSPLTTNFYWLYLLHCSLYSLKLYYY